MPWKSCEARQHGEQMVIDILTIFPAMFKSPFEEGIVSRAAKESLLKIRVHNLRRFTQDKHGTVDDYVYGGGPGMLMKPEPFFEAVDWIRLNYEDSRESSVILLTPQGKVFNQEKALDFSRRKGLVFLCGRYEGIDERVAVHLADEQVSIGKYVLGGGELAAMVLIECIVRLLPGALGNQESLAKETFNDGLLKFPQYTRPAIYRGWEVPSILLSGYHARIAQWRKEQALRRTGQK